MLQWSTQNEGEDPSTLKPAHICTSALGGESVNSGQEMLFPYWLLSRWTWTKFSYLFFWHNQKKGSDSTPIAGSTLQVSKLSPQGASSIASCCAARFLEQTNFFPGGRRVFHRMTVEVEKHSVLAEVVASSKSRFVEHYISYMIHIWRYFGNLM